MIITLSILRVNIHNDCDANFITLYIPVEQSPFEMIVAIGFFRCIFLCALYHTCEKSCTVLNCY